MYNRFQDYINRNRRQNTLEAQARAEADSRRRETREQQQQHPQQTSSPSLQSPSRVSNISSPQHYPSQSSTNSTFEDCYHHGEPLSPLQSPGRNQTSLSYGSVQSYEDEEEEEIDQFDVNVPLGHECFKFEHAHSTANNGRACSASAAATAPVQQSLGILCPQQTTLPQMFYLNVSSAEGGKQLRSASFDGQILLGVKGSGGGNSLDLPEGYRNTRSRSFDYAHVGKNEGGGGGGGTPTPTGSPVKTTTTTTSTTTTATQPTSGQPSSPSRKARPQRTDSTASHGSTSFLDIPKWKLIIRRPSSTSTAESGSNTPDTMLKDCVHCVYFNELYMSQTLTPPMSDSVDSDNSSYNEDDEYEHDAAGGESSEHEGSAKEMPIINTNNIQLPIISIRPDPNEAIDEYPDDEYIEPIQGLPIVTLCPPEADSISIHEEDEGSGITVVSLEVPVMSGSKQGRSASVDSPYLLQVPQRTDIEVREGPPKARSKSVDIVLPTTIGGSYMPVIVPLRQQPITTK